MRKATPHVIWSVLILTLLLIAGCNLAPQRSVAPTETVVGFVLPTPEPTLTPTPRATVTPLPAEDNCTDYVSYVSDINYDDNTEVQPEERIDKRWMVKNTGTCNWGPGYVWKLQEDSGIEVPKTFDIYPAVQGNTVTIRLEFTAPLDPGVYKVEYIPIGPDGTSIGDNIYVQFIVAETTE
jgi:hypothetical protein